MSDIAGLQQRIREFCDERDWGQFHNPKDLAVSLCLEAAEVLEQARRYGNKWSLSSSHSDKYGGASLVD